MRVTLATSAVLFGLALANPVARRQELDYDAYESANAVASTVAPPIGDAAPQETASYNPAAVESAVVANIISAPPSDATDAPAAVVGKRAATSCTTRTINGPKVTQPADTPEAFLAYQPFTDAAMNAAVPAGYEATEGFVNIQATAQNKNYLTYTSKITAYDPAQCAAVCDGMAGCNAFVIYNERVPLLVSTLTQVPDANVCPGTATSSSGTLIKCAFYGQPVTTDQATNAYQFQGKFKVVWTGANAYSKVVPPLAGWRGPVSFNGKAIDAPAPAKAGFLRSQTFGANVPFDPSQCATGCVTLTAANAQSGNFSGAACMFFDAFIMYKNGLNGVFTCNYYSIEYDATFATNSGSTDANGNKFTVDHSYGYYVDLDLQSTCSSIFVSTTTILPTATITSPVITYQRRGAAGVVNVPAAASPSAFYSACSYIGITSTVSTTTAPTATSTVYPAATCNQGLEYAVYYLNHDANSYAQINIPTPNLAMIRNPAALFNYSIFDGAVIVGSGSVPTIGTDSTWNFPYPTNLYSGPALPTNMWAVQYRGYFRPTMKGDYKFQAQNTDDFLGIWLGTNAKQGWTYANANMFDVWPNSSKYVYFTVDDSNINTYIPFFVIWGNSDGPGGLDLTFSDPNGAVILSKGSSKNDQILSSCSGGVSAAPAWGQFGFTNGL